ncbi:MAG: hypothetical protein IJ867_02270 [Clostridia bacterium]|nr:hypothetical protein [Clostridia bacterium]
MNKKVILVVCIIIIIVIIFVRVNKNKKIDEIQNNKNLVDQKETEEEIIIDNLYYEENLEEVFHESDLADNFF